MWLTRRVKTDTQERCPFTKDVLRILPHLSRSIKHGATIQAAFCLAFAALVRVGEFTYESRDLCDEDFDSWFLSRRRVRLYEDHQGLTQLSSKTHPFRRRVTKTVAATNNEACTVRALKSMSKRCTASLSSPLFEIQALRSISLRGHCSGHSFRCGAASSARIAYLSEDEIKLLGRWKSNLYRLYIETHLPTLSLRRLDVNLSSISSTRTKLLASLHRILSPLS